MKKMFRRKSATPDTPTGVFGVPERGFPPSDEIEGHLRDPITEQ